MKAIKYCGELWAVMTPRGRLACVLFPPLLLALWPVLHREAMWRRKIQWILHGTE